MIRKQQNLIVAYTLSTAPKVGYPQALDDPNLIVKPPIVPTQMHLPHLRLQIVVPLFPQHELDDRSEG